MAGHDYPAPSWEEFSARFGKRWQQGEHIFISAQTGNGKTELLTKLMRLPKHTVIFVTKPRDKIFRAPEVSDYVRMDNFNPDPATPRILLGPRSAKTPDELQQKQADSFSEAISKIYADQGWTVGFDELAHMSEFMGRRVEDNIKMLHHVGRAYGISVISATQRPFRIPVIVPESASHAFIGKTSRSEDLRRVANISPYPKDAMEAIAHLPGKHDFVYLDASGRTPIQIVNTRRT